MRKKIWMGMAVTFGLGCVGLGTGLIVELTTDKYAHTWEVDPSNLDQEPVAAMEENEFVDPEDTDDGQDATTRSKQEIFEDLIDKLAGFADF